MFLYPLAPRFYCWSVFLSQSVILADNKIVKTTVTDEIFETRAWRLWIRPYHHAGHLGISSQWIHCVWRAALHWSFNSLGVPVYSVSKLPLILGVLCIIIGVFLRITVVVDFPWLLWLGFVPSHFYTLDYFPLLPWFGVVLIGIFLGNSLYQNNKRKFSLKDHSQFIVNRGVCFLGRHSLIIYLLHQLIIVGLLYVSRLVVNGSRIV